MTARSEHGSTTIAYIFCRNQAPDGAENLVKMHEELQTKRAVTEQLSRDLEDPGNLVRCDYYCVVSIPESGK